jgi:PTH1 family peptidyl-tRNA hydrolase
MYIIAGLGNPGRRYESTRHNAGFLTLDILSKKWGIPIKKIGFHSTYGEGLLGNEKLVLVKPQLFMNRSGEAISSVVNFYKIPLGNLIVIYDDVDLPLGKIRIRKCGSAGTHNGMKSVIYQLQSEDFLRVRIGIDRPPPEWDLADYVLAQCEAGQKDNFRAALQNAAMAAEVIIREGADEAQKRFNGSDPS